MQRFATLVSLRLTHLLIATVLCGLPISGIAQQGLPAFREPGRRPLAPSKPAEIKYQLTRASEQSSKAGIKRRTELVAAGLRTAPQDPDILYYAAWLAIDQGQYAKAQALLDRLTPTAAAQPRVQKLRRAIAQHPIDSKLVLAEEHEGPFLHDPSKKNMLQVETYPAFASDRQHPWFYNNFTYGRETEHGPFYASVNQAMRNNITGYQYVASGYPKVNDYLYFFGEYAYSDSSLYPQDKATLRANIVLPDDVEIGPGGQYYLIQQKELWAYTVWLSKQFGNNWLAIKPLFYKQPNLDSYLYMVVNYRYYFSQPDRFLALAFGIGKTPDLLDLNAAGFVIVNQTDYFVSYHFDVKENVHLYLGGGYVRQVYPTGLIRKIPTMLYGLNFDF